MKGRSLVKRAVTDTSTLLSNQINVKESLYNGRYAVSVVATNSFNYYVEETLKESPQHHSKLSYITTVLIPLGVHVTIQNGGVITTTQALHDCRCRTSSTSGAIISGKHPWQIKKTIINDIGFDFPSDTTWNQAQQFLRLYRLNLWIRLILLNYFKWKRTHRFQTGCCWWKDQETSKRCWHRYTIGDSNVTIFKNTFGINNVSQALFNIKQQP